MHINVVDACREALRDPLEASSLPPALYLDPDVFEQERERVFGRAWVAVAREEDLVEVGDYVTYDNAGDPLVAVRTNDGLRAYSNVCLHRNTLMLEGSGRVRAIQCPYHLWTYGLDGHLAGAPSMEQAVGFDRNDLCLPELQVETWQGWVFVNFDADAVPLSAQVGGLDERLAGFGLPNLRRVGTLEYPSPWNWKVTVENFIESYHTSGIHPSLQSMWPSQLSSAVENGGEPWAWLNQIAIVDGKRDADALKVATLFPLHMFAMNGPGMMVWLKLQVRTHDHAELSIETFASQDTYEDEAAKATMDRSRQINDEDVEINRRTAAGLRSRLARPGRLSHLEIGVWQFRQWLVGMLQQG